MTGHSEVDRHPESAFRSRRHLTVPAHLTESGLCFHWAGPLGNLAGAYARPDCRISALQSARAYNPYWRPAMTEFSFPCVPVSSSGDEYFQVCFQEADDRDRKSVV